VCACVCQYVCVQFVSTKFSLMLSLTSTEVKQVST